MHFCLQHQAEHIDKAQVRVAPLPSEHLMIGGTQMLWVCPLEETQSFLVQKNNKMSKQDV
jgi:hypothetical protein